MTTLVVVERTHHLSILSSFALSSVDGNFTITVWIGARGANRRACFQICSVPHHHLVFAAAMSSSGSATSASCCSRHVQRLPRQVERQVLVITSWEEALRQTSVLVEFRKSTRLAGICQLGFQLSDLMIKKKKTNTYTIFHACRMIAN